MKFTNIAKIKFTSDLLKWNQGRNTRIMPWKGEKDPYKIWLSEVILQQTRVSQGLGYYERFIIAFPNIHLLAQASEEQVIKLWEGLGYYSRCRNLLETARHISFKNGGIFPADYDQLLQLKGVGPYTAAAISSFAFQLPHAVVDGNVFRVLSRIFGINQPIDTSMGRMVFAKLANELLDNQQSGTYNQAIMDFGATICMPHTPLCDQCPFNLYCQAYIEGRVFELPVKEKKIQITERWFYYLVLECEGQIVIKQRNERDIWNGLYEFVLIEKNKETKPGSLIDSAMKGMQVGNKDFTVGTISPVIKQQLSHQKIIGRFIRVTLRHVPRGYENLMVPKIGLKKLAFPQFINTYLRNHYV